VGVDDTGDGNSLCRICGAANSDTEATLNHLVLHRIACGLSYFAFSTHGVGISGLLIMTFGG
jgi:hypothetical protein